MHKKNHKKKQSKELGLISAGVGLSLGSAAVGALPASAASAGVQAGLGTAGGFFSPMVNIQMGGMVIKQLKELKGGNK